MCNLEFPDLEQTYQTHRSDGLQIIGVAQGGLGGGESEATVLRFIDQTQVTFPVGWDDDGSYRAFAWPSAVSPFPRQALIGPDGTVLYTASEYDQAALETAIEEALAQQGR